MPRRPWHAISAIDPGAARVMVTTHATLRHRRDLPRFAASAQSLWMHLQAADGLLGYELQASILSGTLSTVSAWRDQDTLAAFTRGSAHQKVIAQTQQLVAETRIRSWVTTGQELTRLQTSATYARAPT